MRVDPSSIPSEVAPLAIASFTSTWLVTSAYPLSARHLRPWNGIYSNCTLVRCNPPPTFVAIIYFSIPRMRFPVLTALVYFLYVHLSMKYRSYTHKEPILQNIRSYQRIFIHFSNIYVRLNSEKWRSVVRINTINVRFCLQARQFMLEYVRTT